MQVTIISWNIWHGKYLGGVIDYLKSAAPDIIGLQEVIEHTENGERINQAEEIAKALGYAYVYCKAFSTDRHQPAYDQGNAILSRYPIESSDCYMLSTIADYKGSADTEPRCAVKAEVKIGSAVLCVMNTHLAYSAGLQPSSIRFKQLKQIMSHVTKQMVLLGDFNSEPDSEVVKTVTGVLQHTDSQLQNKTWSVYPANFKGFSVKGLTYRIDYIFASKDIQVIKAITGYTRASDHLPVTTIITL